MDLFSVTAPLKIRLPTGEERVMVDRYPHPRGLLYLEPFWPEREDAVHLVEGPIQGEGPWNIGGCVVTVLGCQGTDPEIAAEFAQWQSYLASVDPEQARDAAERLAREWGAEAGSRS